jgi:hypothetical protein
VPVQRYRAGSHSSGSPRSSSTDLRQSFTAAKALDEHPVVPSDRRAMDPDVGLASLAALGELLSVPQYQTAKSE